MSATAGRLVITALGIALALAPSARAEALVVPVSARGEMGAGSPAASSAAGSAGGRVQVVSDPAGSLDAATWTDRAAGRDRLLVAIRRGGAWSAPQALASSPVSRSTTSLVPTPVRLVTGADGTAHLLWGSLGRGDGSPRRWSVASLTAAGTWSQRTIARTSGRRRLGASADLTARPDGSLVVAWSTATLAPTDVQQERAIPAGRLRITERTVDGAWQAARTVGASHGISAEPTLVTSPSGAVAVTWAPTSGDDPDPPDRARWSIRAADGSWPLGGTAPVSAGFGIHALLDRRERLHLFRGGFGPWGLAGVAETVVGPKPGAAPKPSNAPAPTEAQSRGGWLGAGYLHTVDVALDAADQTVVIWGGEPYDVERGGYGTGAVWSAVRASSGTWSVGPVDPLTATTGALDVDLGTDPAGRIVATWSASTTDCRSLVYRSVRQPDGAWSPRSVVAVGGRGQPSLDDDEAGTSGCTAVTPHLTGGSQPLAWWVQQAPRRLAVTPLELPASAAPDVAIDVAATTWAQVRAAGGLPIRCSAAVEVVCSASVVEAIAGLPRAESESDPVRYRRGALARFALRASAFVAPAADGFTLPVKPYGDGTAPITISFDVLVTAEVVGGSAPVVRRIPVTLTR
ncbi:MAG: hypothetical protein PGN13_09330 [Patulibacter minatonensis]